MLTRIGVTTTACDEHTKRTDLDHFLERADLVVTAFPKCEEDRLIRYVKKGAIVVDCSNDGNLHPDVVEQASYISTHNNHLGQVTTALALYNTALCVRWQKGMKRKY